MDSINLTILGIIVCSTLILVLWVSVETNYEEIKKWFGWKLTAKRARKIAEKKAEKREDEDFYYILYSIQETADRGGREIIRWELSEKEVERIEDLGFDVIQEQVSDKRGWKYTIKW